MKAAYCTVADVKSRLSGDQATMSAAWDATIAQIIMDISQEIDREVARHRAQPVGLWGFLADSTSEVQQIFISSGQVAPTAGTFTLSFGGQTTSALAFNASAAAVQSALQALSSIGSGNAVVSGPAGGPYRVVFGGTRTGPQALIAGDGTGLTPSSPINVVELVQAVAASPSARLFTGVAGNVSFLPIDDCLSVSGVNLYSTPGILSRALVVNTDYIARPLRGSPIYGIDLISDVWPTVPGTVQVTAVWGFSTTVPGDVHQATVVESVRAYLAARAGENDSIGVTPWGSLVTSKAFTSKTWKMIADYRLGGGMLRGG